MSRVGYYENPWYQTNLKDLLRYLLFFVPERFFEDSKTEVAAKTGPQTAENQTELLPLIPKKDPHEVSGLTPPQNKRVSISKVAFERDLDSVSSIPLTDTIFQTRNRNSIFKPAYSVKKLIIGAPPL